MRPAPLLTTLATLLALTGCGTPAEQPATTSSGQGTGTTVATTHTTTTTPTPADRCGPRTLTATPSTPPAAQCLTVGAVLRIQMPDSPAQPWSWPSSSDDSVLRCAARQLPQGAAEAVCSGRRAGTATVTTTTGPFAGDPHGPPQTPWQVTITVR
ncbi:hypothetical protein [Amycolatopsis sp. NPDC004378]